MLVKRAPAKRSPSVRSCTRACDEHSMKQWVQPASTISRIMALRRMASGVVWVEGSVRSPTR